MICSIILNYNISYIKILKNLYVKLYVKSLNILLYN